MSYCAKLGALLISMKICPLGGRLHSQCTASGLGGGSTTTLHLFLFPLFLPLPLLCVSADLGMSGFMRQDVKQVFVVILGVGFCAL